MFGAAPEKTDEAGRMDDQETGMEAQGGALRDYLRLVSAVDEFVGKVVDRYGSLIRCGPGCASCCQRSFRVFPVEAWAVRVGVPGLPESITEDRRRGLRSASRGVCPALAGDRCRIYPFRPIICRTHGFPMLVEREEGGREVRFCERNFRSSGRRLTLSGEFVLDLERLNEALARVHSRFMKSWGEGRRSPIPHRVGILHFVGWDEGDGNG